MGARRKPGGIVIEVHDNGKGMSPETLEEVRGRGAKGADSTSHGLGLAIAQDLAEQQHITFDLASTLGTGTMARIFISNEVETT